jgi:hypothetical protein
MEADIFLLYPTVTFIKEEADFPHVRIDNPVMSAGAREWLERVECATSEGNIYAPLYRQLNGVMLAGLTRATFEEYTMTRPRDDVAAAFGHFLTRINKNERPFILLGHSQGGALAADCATRMLGSEIFRPYNKNHLATYAAGYALTPGQLARNPHLKFAGAPDEAGVILAWNTTAPGEIASGAYQRFGTWDPESLTVNPITWTTSETLAPADANGASLVFRPDGSCRKVEHYADAAVDNTHRVLVAAAVPEADYQSKMPGTVSKYHPFDISFYYESIRQNIKDRITAFRGKGFIC